MTGATDRLGLLPCGCKVALVVSAVEPHARIDWCNLHAAAKTLLEGVIWMSGCTCFSEKGEAHGPWATKYRPLVFKILEALPPEESPTDVPLVPSQSSGPGAGGTHGL